MAITLDGTNGITAPGTETFGDGTALGGATNPIVSMTKGANNYVQGYIVNNTNGTSSSSDFVAYPSNGTDTHGWVDMGITSLAYADSVYTVTGPNEAYVFGSAPTGSTGTGNLVFATDNTGTANSIQFYTGGFTQAKSAAKMTINSSGAVAYGTSYGTSGQFLTSNGSSAAPTWSSNPALGTPASGTLSNCTVDGTNAVGFKNIPQNAQSGSYTLVLADSGKHIYHALGDGAATYTIPAASSVAYPIGTAITFVNLSATSVSIAITTDTMYLSSAGTTGTRTLAQYGSATAIKVSGLSSSGIWVISGSGLT